MKKILNDFTSEEEWNEKFFFVEDLNFIDQPFMFIQLN